MNVIASPRTQTWLSQQRTFTLRRSSPRVAPHCTLLRAWMRLHSHRVFGPSWNPCKVQLDAGYCAVADANPPGVHVGRWPLVHVCQVSNMGRKRQGVEHVVVFQLRWSIGKLASNMRWTCGVSISPFLFMVVQHHPFTKKEHQTRAWKMRASPAMWLLIVGILGYESLHAGDCWDVSHPWRHMTHWMLVINRTMCLILITERGGWPSTIKHSQHICYEYVSIKYEIVVLVHHFDTVIFCSKRLWWPSGTENVTPKAVFRGQWDTMSEAAYYTWIVSTHDSLISRVYCLDWVLYDYLLMDQQETPDDKWQCGNICSW